MLINYVYLIFLVKFPETFYLTSQVAALGEGVSLEARLLSR